MRKFLIGFVAVVGLLGTAKWVDAATLTFGLDDLKAFTIQTDLSYDPSFYSEGPISLTIYDETDPGYPTTSPGTEKQLDIGYRVGFETHLPDARIYLGLETTLDLSSYGIDTLALKVANDNQSTYKYGLWVWTATDGLNDDTPSAPLDGHETTGDPEIVSLSYSLSSLITAGDLDLSGGARLGFYIEIPDSPPGPSQSGDTGFVSASAAAGDVTLLESLPEPASLAVWGGLCAFGLIGGARRRRNRRA